LVLGALFLLAELLKALTAQILYSQALHLLAVAVAEVTTLQLQMAHLVVLAAAVVRAVTTPIQVVLELQIKVMLAALLLDVTLLEAAVAVLAL
jgi:hypothetical protein